MWSQKWSCFSQHTGFGLEWKFFKLLAFLFFECFQFPLLNFWLYFSFRSKYIKWEHFPRIPDHARVNNLWRTGEYIFFIWLSWIICLTFSWVFRFLQVPVGFMEIGFYLQLRKGYGFPILRQLTIFLLVQFIILESRNK